MAEIQPLLVNLTEDFYNNLIKKAVVVIDGVTYQKDISHTSTRHGLRKYVKLVEEQGTITRAALVDSLGRELYVKEMNYTIGTQGYVIAFPLSIETKEVRVNG